MKLAKSLLLLATVVITGTVIKNKIVNDNKAILNEEPVIQLTDIDMPEIIAQYEPELIKIDTPLFNFREISKHMAILEGELIQNKCKKCVQKRLLIIEGLAEEIEQLDQDKEFTFFSEQLPISIREITEDYRNNIDKGLLSYKIKNLREEIMGISFNEF